MATPSQAIKSNGHHNWHKERIEGHGFFTHTISCTTKGKQRHKNQNQHFFATLVFLHDRKQYQCLATSFIDYTKEAVEMGQDQIVTITATDYSIIDFEGNPAEGKPFHMSGTQPQPKRAASTPSWRRKSTSSHRR